jgi:hypothetical protein
MIGSDAIAEDRSSGHVSSQTMYKDMPVRSKNRSISVIRIVPHDGISHTWLAGRPLNADCVACAREYS